MAYDFSKKNSLQRPRDKAFSNWAKFPKVGDKVEGYIRDAFFHPAKGVYKDARGITLEQIDGTLINVTVKRLDFILPLTDSLHVGDPLTIVYESDKDNGPGVNPTKVMGYYGEALPENKENPTVKELDDQSKAEGGFVTETDEAKNFDKPVDTEKPPFDDKPKADAPAA